VLAPVLENGWCLLGEAKKIVVASGRRVVSVKELDSRAGSGVNDCHDGYCRTGETYKNNRRTTGVTGGLEVTLLVASDEKLELWLLAPASTWQIRPEFELVKATCPSRRCTGVDCDAGVKVTYGNGNGADCACVFCKRMAA